MNALYFDFKTGSTYRRFEGPPGSGPRQLNQKWLPVGRGISQKFGCSKCNDGNYDDLYTLDDKDIMCSKCINTGVYKDRTIIPRNAIKTPLRQSKKYGGQVAEEERNNNISAKTVTTSWENFENSMPQKLESRGDLKEQLASNYMMFGEPDENMLDTLTYAIGVASHYYDHLNELPPMLLANIYSGLTKFSNDSQRSGRGINLDELYSFPQLKSSVKNNAFELLNTITQK